MKDWELDFCERCGEYIKESLGEGGLCEDCIIKEDIIKRLTE